MELPKPTTDEVRYAAGVQPRVSKVLPRFRDWARENLKLADKHGNLSVFELNEIQLELDDEYERQLREVGYVRLVVLKARQMGASVWAQGRLFFDVWARENWKTGVMAHDVPGCDFVFERTQVFNEELPDPLKRPQKYGNRREIAYKAPHRSSMRVNVAKGRGGFGRGGTIMGVHLSEVAFWKRIRGQSSSQGQANAIKNSIPRTPGTSIVVESTANGMGGEFYDLYTKAKAGKNEFKALFFPWFKFKEYRFCGKKPDDFFAEPEWMEDETTLRLMGCDDEQLAWRRFMIATNCEGDLDAFHQEYPSTDEEAFLTSGRPVFTPSIVNRRLAEILKREDAEPTRRYAFDEFGRLYEDKRGELRIYREAGTVAENLVMTADVAEGIERKAEDKQGDYSVIDVFDRRNHEQIAQWHGHVDPVKFGDVIYMLGRLYGFPRVVPEANNHGRVTIRRLQELSYPSIYFREIVADSSTMVEVKYTKYGWETTPKTKPYMVSLLRKLWIDRNIRVNAQETCSEHLTYVRKQNGSTEAESNRYDDRVITCAIYAAYATLHPPSTIVVDNQPVQHLGMTGADVLREMGVGELNRRPWGRRL